MPQRSNHKKLLDIIVETIKIVEAAIYVAGVLDVFIDKSLNDNKSINELYDYINIIRENITEIFTEETANLTNKALRKILFYTRDIEVPESL